MPEDEYIIKTALRSPFKNVVEHVVQMRSGIQANGNLVFNLAVLLAFESDQGIQKTTISQAFIGACMRSVCCRASSTSSRPPLIDFIGKDSLPFLRAAQKSVIGFMTSFDDDSGLTETLNQAAREYKTVFDNNVWMNFSKWQQSSIRAELSKLELPADTWGFIIKKIMQAVNRATDGPDPTKYKSKLILTLAVPFLGSPAGLALISRFTRIMSKIPSKEEEKETKEEAEEKKDWNGITAKSHIKGNIHLFIEAGLALMNRVASLRAQLTSTHTGAGLKGSPKLPKLYQILPQLKFKVRAVTFGKEQTRELAKRIVRLHPHLASGLVSIDEITDKKVIKVAADTTRVMKSTKKVTWLQEQLEKLLESKQTLKVQTKQLKLQASLVKAEGKLLAAQKTLRGSQKRASKKRKLSDSANRSNTKRQRTMKDISTPKLTDAQWRSLTDVVFDRLFQVPRVVNKRSFSKTRVVTTDGVSASWHLTRNRPKPQPKTKAKRKNKDEPTPVPLSYPIQSRSYGLHGTDVLCSLRPTTTIIAVDPGHANIISAVRFHTSDDPEAEPPPSIAPQTPRHHARDVKLTNLRLSTFELKNTVWRQWNGNSRYAQRVASQDKRHNLEAAINQLALASSRVSTSREYLRHAAARVATSPLFRAVMALKNRRRWKFDSYQTEQRAVKKLSTVLLDGVKNKSDVILAWGNGSFGPTSRGHASAPNKCLRKALGQFIPIVIVNEYNTSKRSCCCHTEIKELKTPEYKKRKKRATVVQCSCCQTLLSRDVSAAVNIGNVFKHQVQHQSSKVPDYLARKA